MKVFLYIRVACADQLAAASQREELERYAKDKGYEVAAEGRVPGAIRIGTVWGIPEDAEKPADARIKNGKYIKKPAENEK